MSNERPLPNRVKQLRQQVGWSQDQLAEKARISRAAVSAIEIHRLTPSVAVALALAKVFSCHVEDLFGEVEPTAEEEWAWLPTNESTRYWVASVGRRTLRYPVEMTVAGLIPHDGVLANGEYQPVREVNPEKNLVMASCDPAAGIMATAFERATGYRLIPLYRNSREALDLLGKGLVHLAGIHLATEKSTEGNAQIVQGILGSGYTLIPFAMWEEGLTVEPSRSVSSVRGVLGSNLRWVGRAEGAAARECQNEVLGERRAPRHIARDHQGVAEAVRGGWADVGVCLRLVSEQAGLRFIHLRNDSFEFCLPTTLESDPRVKKLMEFLRSPSLHRQFDGLPGYRLVRPANVHRIS